MLLISSVSLFAFNAKNETEPVFKSIEFANIELLNLEKDHFGDFLFKKNDCETGGFSFFSPFHEAPSLSSSVISSEKISNLVKINVKTIDNEFNFTIDNVSISENGEIATFDAKIGNLIFPTKINGSELSVENVLAKFSNFKNSNIIAEDCGSCAAFVLAYITYQVSQLCQNVQNTCSPCNGALTVGACSCSCTPVKN